MRVLLTAERLVERASCGEKTLNLARLLQARGHLVMAYGSDWAQLARTVEIDSMPLVADLTRLTVRPDIIHALNPHDAITALAALPDVPALCQFAAEVVRKIPPRHPRLYRLLWDEGETNPPGASTPAGWLDNEVVIFGSKMSDLEKGRALESLYEEIIAGHSVRPPDWPAEARALLEYLQGCYPALIQLDREVGSDWKQVDRFLWAKTGTHSIEETSSGP